MKVFISWSGEKSASHRLAQQLKEWIESALQNTEAFLSSKDLHTGGRWQGQLSETLEACDFGIACLTDKSKIAPWILFESGALAKKTHDSRLIALLWNIEFSEISNNPLSMFNNVRMTTSDERLNKESAYKVLDAINTAAGALNEKNVPVEKLKEGFEKWYWPDLKERLTKVKELAAAPAKPEPNTGAAIEEMLGLVRTIARMLEPRTVVGEHVYSASLGGNSSRYSRNLLEVLRGTPSTTFPAYLTLGNPPRPHVPAPGAIPSDADIQQVTSAPPKDDPLTK